MKYEINSSDKILDLKICSDITTSNVDEIRLDTLEIINSDNLTDENWNFVDIDLLDANVIDSSGLNFLVTLNRHVMKLGKKVRIYISSPHIHRTFLYVRMDKKMEIILKDN